MRLCHMVGEHLLHAVLPTIATIRSVLKTCSAQSPTSLFLGVNGAQLVQPESARLGEMPSTTAPDEARASSHPLVNELTAVCIQK